MAKGVKGAKELVVIAKNLQRTEKVMILEYLAETGGKSNAFTEAVYTWRAAEEFVPHSSGILKNIKVFSSITTKSDILNIIKPNWKWIGKKGSNSYSRLFKGEKNEANQIFNKLTKNGNLIFQNNKKIISKLSDEVYITYKPLSESDPPTIDIKLPGIKDNIKLKFLENN